MEPEVRGTSLPAIDNFVALFEQIIMLKTVQKWQRYNQLKFGPLRKRIWEVC